MLVESLFRATLLCEALKISRVTDVNFHVNPVSKSLPVSSDPDSLQVKL